MARYVDVDDYLASLAPDAAEALDAARATIHQAVAGGGETISYQIAAFTVGGRIFMYVGAWKRHLGIYPVPVFDDDLEAEVTPYRAKTDTVQFPYRAGVPHELLGRIATAMAMASTGAR